MQSVDFKNNTSVDDGFLEGRLVVWKHKPRERNQALISATKDAFVKNNATLHCEVCGFGFEEKYGDRGRGFIEAHHTVPVSDIEPGQKTRIEDIALVCSNCHRMFH
ncbi:HNH endonuclease [Zooshikella marina]|uniref:HNH endonuclease n=1 Tax=Zooshikella ganghwensis TaxID=202772 RepID=UPI001BB075EE|nr:HNH endonuclease [Zooshikella ganghwensis]